MFISSFCVFVLYCLFVFLVCFPTDISVFLLMPHISVVWQLLFCLTGLSFFRNNIEI